TPPDGVPLEVLAGGEAGLGRGAASPEEDEEDCPLAPEDRVVRRSRRVDKATPGTERASSSIWDVSASVARSPSVTFAANWAMVASEFCSSLLTSSSAASAFRWSRRLARVFPDARWSLSSTSLN